MSLYKQSLDTTRNEMIHRITSSIPQQDGVAYQLSEIKNEIAELRKQLLPTKSILITGSEVERILSLLKDNI